MTSEVIQIQITDLFYLSDLNLRKLNKSTNLCFITLLFTII